MTVWIFAQLRLKCLEQLNADASSKTIRSIFRSFLGELVEGDVGGPVGVRQWCEQRTGPSERHAPSRNYVIANSISVSINVTQNSLASSQIEKIKNRNMSVLIFTQSMFFVNLERISLRPERIWLERPNWFRFSAVWILCQAHTSRCSTVSPRGNQSAVWLLCTWHCSVSHKLRGFFVFFFFFFFFFPFFASQTSLVGSWDRIFCQKVSETARKKSSQNLLWTIVYDDVRMLSHVISSLFVNLFPLFGLITSTRNKVSTEFCFSQCFLSNFKTAFPDECFCLLKNEPWERHLVLSCTSKSCTCRFPSRYPSVKGQANWISWRDASRCIHKAEQPRMFPKKEAKWWTRRKNPVSKQKTVL